MNTNTTKHTPGPWRVRNSILNPGSRGDVKWALVISPQQGNGFIARIMKPLGDLDRQAANAKLIAAAPELLAALEKITLAYESARKLLYELQGSADNTPLLEEARAAIAKATQS